MNQETRRTAETVRWAVSRLAQRLRAQQGKQEEKLTRVAASVLANLRHDGPLSVSALADIEGLQPQSLTRTLNTLADSGFLMRERDEHDRRQQRLVITESGRAALDEHVRDGNAWLAQALHEGLTPAERSVVRIAAELLLEVASAEEAADAGPRAAGASPAL
ncbi:MarR family winged helix-turn-helix transcriptional regulator [Amycolatopsis lurida]